MSLQHAIGVAFHTTWTDLRSEASDVVRAIEDGDFTLGCWRRAPRGRSRPTGLRIAALS